MTSRPSVRLLLSVLLPLVLALGFPSPAGAVSDPLQAAASALASDRLYVDPTSELAPEVDEAALRAALGRTGTPVFVAVVPAAPDPDRLPGRLAQLLGEPGSYVVLSGSALRAGSTQTAPGVAGSLAARAVAGSGGDVTAGLVGLVSDLDAAASTGPARPPAPAPSGSGALLLVPLLLFFLVPFLFLGGFLLLVRTVFRGASRSPVHVPAPYRPDPGFSEDFVDVERTAREDVDALSADLASFDPSGAGALEPALAARVQDAHQAGLDAYDVARSALESARTVEDFARVSSAVEDGRFALATASALLAGRPLPEHSPPCFFDPRHGPSVGDVSWAPPRGQLRRVPVCQADRVRVEDGEEPGSRMVWSHGQQVPLWSAPPAYGPFAGGYFGVGTGLFGGLLLGSMLGGGFGSFGDGYSDGFGGDFGGGGGDFGGDFGGGGGDFGDFGGGGGNW